MLSPVTVGKIYSTLGNNNSLVPLAMKDVANSLGLTAGSYAVGDKYEGKDRFMDEFGTQAIWLFGIPAYKKILDLTLFKSLKLDPKVDVRILKNKDILEKAKKFAANDEIAKSLENVSKKQSLFKGLTIGKFAVSTLLTIASYWGLTKYRHKATEAAIKKDILLKQQEEKTQNSAKSAMTSPAFSAVHKQNAKKPSFTGLQDFMFSPVKNLMIVDGAITTERLTQARNKQDFMGYVIKEGAFWGFVYFAGQRIQEHFEDKSERKYNRSIDLDSRVIESEELKKAFKDGTLKNSLKEFDSVMDKSDAEIYEFINNNKDNFVVQMAKKSDILKTVKDSDAIDTRYYVSIGQVKGVNRKLAKLEEQFEHSKLHQKFPNEEKALNEFLKQVKKLKRISVLKNIGACVGALGIAVPALMVASRYAGGKKQDFQVKKDIEKQLAFEADQKQSK
ncbi:MAG: hypothetical protein LKG27_05320 [Clostridiaceae bacterium]|jgi:hypothetical protein|nr:hypothetical protein [Clostridiaceae bacterium]